MPRVSIGDAEIRLLEYAGAFAAFGNEGRAVRPRAVRRLEAPRGVLENPSGSAGALAFTDVFACGASYRFQRRLGWGLPAVFTVGAQAEARVRSADALDVFCLPDVASPGFGWLLSHAGPPLPPLSFSIVLNILARSRGS